MSLIIDPGSNVALPLFGSGNSPQMLGFDDENRMYITTDENDTVTPPKGVPAEMLCRWYTCQTLYGYTYTTLAWVYGKSPPENPSCQMVDVIRVWKTEKA